MSENNDQPVEIPHSDPDMRTRGYKECRFCGADFQHTDDCVTRLPKRESGDRVALEKIARAAESNSPDAHYLGNVARDALGLLPLPKKEPRV